MSKQMVHFAAFGYEPMRMKPVHFATGFFLSLTGHYYALEELNKLSTVKHKTGLHDDYSHENLLLHLRDNVGAVSSRFTEPQLKLLRGQINSVVDNDGAVFPVYSTYKSFGNDYTLVSERLVTLDRRLDGYAGHFVHQVLESTPTGREVLDFARSLLAVRDCPIDHLVAPVLDNDSEQRIWNNRYAELFGELTEERLNQIANTMAQQTAAVAQLCKNLSCQASHPSKTRGLIVALCTWLFVYMQRLCRADFRIPILLMDFTGGQNRRARSMSRNCYSRLRDMFFRSYFELREAGRLDFDDEIFHPKSSGKKKSVDNDDGSLPKGLDFKFLEQHYSDLAVRIGFAQPRAEQVRQKHFELQPDTARLLLWSVLEAQEITKSEEVATRLRKIWGICFGGSENDQAILRESGYAGLDQDEDLQPNADAFVGLLKRLNLAIEPSDGLVLCTASPENLI